MGCGIAGIAASLRKLSELQAPTQLPPRIGACNRDLFYPQICGGFVMVVVWAGAIEEQEDLEEEDRIG